MGYDPLQAIWYEYDGYNLDTKLYHERSLDAVVAHGLRNNFLLMTACATLTFAAVCNERKARFFGDVSELCVNKAWLHSLPPRSSSESMFKDAPAFPSQGVHVPRGYTCLSAADIWLACEEMFSDGVAVLYLKPSHTSGGHGIRLIRTLQEIQLLLPSIVESFNSFATSSHVLSYVVEEAVNTVKDANSSPTSHYWNGEPCPGEVNEQLFEGPLYKGSVSYCSESAVVVQSCRAMTAALQEALQYKGFWGVDFVIDRITQQPVLVDLNVGRVCGGHIPRLFADLFAPDRSWRIIKVSIPQTGGDSYSIQRQISTAGLAFDMETKTGMIVMSTEPGANTRAMAFAASQQEVDELFRRFSTALRVMRMQAMDKQRLEQFSHVTAVCAYDVRSVYMVYNPTQDTLAGIRVLLPLPDLRDTQQLVHSVSFQKPEDTVLQFYVDAEGQQYAELFMDVPAQQRVAVGWTITVSLCPPTRIDLMLDPSATHEVPPEVAEVYASSDEHAPVDPMVLALAKQIVGSENNVLLQVQMIHDFICERMSYRKSQGNYEVDVIRLIERGSGSCSEFAHVLCSLCSSLGIPTRLAGSTVLGHSSSSDETSASCSARSYVDTTFHRWAEVFVAGYGWIYIDASRNCRLTDTRTYFGLRPSPSLVICHQRGFNGEMGREYCGSNSNPELLRRRRAFFWESKELTASAQSTRVLHWKDEIRLQCAERMNSINIEELPQLFEFTV